MRALSSLLLAGAVGLGGLILTPATAEADGGWRGRHHYRYYNPAPSGYYGYGPPAAYYRARPRVFYGPLPPAYYRPAPPPAFYGSPFGGYAPPLGGYGAPLGGYGPPPAFYAPRSYGIAPGPGVSLWMR